MGRKDWELVMESDLVSRLEHQKLRADALAYIIDHDDVTTESFLDFFGDRMMEISGCDQIIIRSREGLKLMKNAPGVEEVSQELCRQCPFSKYDTDLYTDGALEVADYSKGTETGVMPQKGCPVKSGLMNLIYTDGKLTGLLTMHYMKEHHEFSEHDRSTAAIFAILLGFSFKRIMEKQAANRLLRELKDALTMAQSANRAKTAFLNNMSHDIRTPMNAVIGYTSLATTHIEETDMVRDYLKKIGSAADHLLSLINDILDMSRIESGKMNLIEQKEDLSAIINNIKDIVEADAQAKHLDFFVDSTAIQDSVIVCDKVRLNQVLLNVISNAIKYTPEGGMVVFKVAETGKLDLGYATYEFRIKDNGMGMSKEFLKIVFDPFSRVDSSTVSGIQGTGLGMAITKNIVDMMGGIISIKSEEHKGTEVVITIDFRVAEEGQILTKLPKLEGVHCLVADDDISICTKVSQMLRDFDMRPEWCASGKEALVRTTESVQMGDVFRAFIVGQQLSDMSGTAFAQQVRKTVDINTPIIIMTAADCPDIAAEDNEDVVTDYIIKPMSPLQLQTTLGKYCSGEEIKKKADGQPRNFSGYKALVVEDNDHNREITAAMLKEYGFEVMTAIDGAVAVDIMKQAKPGEYDLVLMDIKMPQMDGNEATRQIRDLDNGRGKVKIVALTANAFEEERRIALEAGVDGYIVKPVEVQRLRDYLAEYL